MVFDSRIAVAEPDNTAHSMSIPHLKMHFRQRKVGKQIPREHRLCDPDKALRGSSFESDSREKDNHALQHTKMYCRDALVLRLRPQTIPCGFLRIRLVSRGGSCHLRHQVTAFLGHSPYTRQRAHSTK